MQISHRIPFNRPFVAGKELYYVAQAVMGGHSAGDGPFTKRCQALLEQRLGTPKALLTHSYASALDMAAMLSDVGPGDEVIMPSFSFVAAANAFHGRGARPVFVDIRADTLNIDETKIEGAVTKDTKAIVVSHYAGIPCEMSVVRDICSRYRILLVDDAANAFGSHYAGRQLGTLGQVGVLSFHETNSIICGEGGAILLNDEGLVERAEIIREKGTNRSKFCRGEVDKYTWVSIGSSFLPSDIVAAFLCAQLELADQIIETRRRFFLRYVQGLDSLAAKGHIRVPSVDDVETVGGHIMYVVTQSFEERSQLISYLGKRGISAIFHYVPLHSSPMGRKHCRVHGELTVTDDISKRLLRLPFFYEMTMDEVDLVIAAVQEFYGQGAPGRTPSEAETGSTR